MQKGKDPPWFTDGNVVLGGRPWFTEKHICANLWDKVWNQVGVWAPRPVLFMLGPNVFPMHSACDSLVPQNGQALTLGVLLP